MMRRITEHYLMFQQICQSSTAVDIYVYQPENIEQAGSNGHTDVTRVL